MRSTHVFALRCASAAGHVPADLIHALAPCVRTSSAGALRQCDDISSRPSGTLAIASSYRVEVNWMENGHGYGLWSESRSSRTRLQSERNGRLYHRCGCCLGNRRYAGLRADGSHTHRAEHRDVDAAEFDNHDAAEDHNAAREPTGCAVDEVRSGAATIAHEKRCRRLGLELR